MIDRYIETAEFKEGVSDEANRDKDVKFIQLKHHRIVRLPYVEWHYISRESDRTEI